MRYLKAGSILRVNLSTGEVSRVQTAKYDDQFVGGRGIQVKILYDEVGPGIDALSPDNLLMFGTGPFTGTLVPGSGRTEITAKSPMTGVLGMSNFGGYFATSLKYAGYDHLVINGKADKPVYLWIDNDAVELRDAGRIWGKDCYETARIIREELGDPAVDVASIGRAGEKLVRYATIQTKKGDGAGRTGMGCVMGSKNLKAVAVRGTKGVKPADPDRFLDACETAQNIMRATGTFSYRSQAEDPVGASDAEDMNDWGKLGLLQVRNFRQTDPQRAYDYPMDAFYQEFKPRRFGCFACPLRCMDNYNVPGKGASVASCMLYVEANWKTDLKDPHDWWETVMICQKDGIDPVSLGTMIGWAMELYETGVINKKQTGGIKLEWGNKEAILSIIEKIITRKDFGAVLAENPAIALKKLGKKDAGRYLMHVKGNPLYNWNSLNLRYNALATAVGNRGDLVRSQTHTDNIYLRSRLNESRGRDPEMGGSVPYTKGKAREIAGDGESINSHVYQGKAPMVVYGENCTAVTDMLLECKWHTPWYITYPMDPIKQSVILSAGAGEEWTEARLVEAAERLITLERAYNAREGLTRDDDTLPDRFFSSTPQPGLFDSDVLEKEKFERMKDEYYALRGWDVKTGIPTRETLEKLGLPDIARDLSRLEVKATATG